MRRKIGILIILISLSSCILRHADGDIDLGNKFYVSVDGKSTTICFNTADEGQNKSGIVLMEPRVVNYNFNNTFIVAKTIDLFDKKSRFYIVDKRMNENALYEYSKSKSSLDSITFFQKLKELGIDLDLYKYPNGSN